MSTLAKVDLPQPDSPTMATVSPFMGGKIQIFIGFDIPNTFAAKQGHAGGVADLVVFFHTVDIENPVADLEWVPWLPHRPGQPVVNFFIA
jgi:hypothetical protein